MLRQRRPRAETPYTDRAIAHAARSNPFARSTPGRLRVAFLGAGLNSHGGTETWHATLIPRLDPARFAILGYGIADQGYFDPLFAERIQPHCPTPLGLDVCRQLCRAAEVVVSWGVTNLAPYVGPRDAPWHPVTIGVSHGDGNSPWTETVFRDADAVIDHYVAVSEAAKGPIPAPRRDSATVIRNAVDADRLTLTRDRASVRAEFGIPESAPLVLYLGRLTEEKRPELAALAVAQLPDVHLALAGAGHLRPRVEAVTQTFADRAHWLGVRSDVANLIAAADVLVSPSFCEGFGLTVAEALWVGTPVVATPTGLLADRTDLARTLPTEAGPDRWAEAIRETLADGPVVSRRSAIAQRFARQHLHPDTFIASWSEYLLEVARPLASKTLSKRSTSSITFCRPSQLDLIANAEACPHRQPTPQDQRSPCGCPWSCSAGLGHPRRKGGVTLSDCWECDQAPRRHLTSRPP